nr:immunoglobulin heavy chain junction region [Macaca mulatta]
CAREDCSGIYCYEIAFDFW